MSGSALHEEDRVRILSGRQQINSTTVSVTPDRRTLTVRLALTTATTGNWSMSVITRGGWERPLGSFKVTPAALKHTKVPTVSGAARVGAKLTARPGTWTPAATSFGHRWYANGQAISGATKSTLTLKSAQRGKKITVRVTAKRTGHVDGSAVTKPTSSVAR
ncbi:hypothetical protein [Streptomyces sp. NPDC059816]|uniref:hypothetical protein n=1 Tax=Streptomyces sp. NPDC059816 TaxID=3346960 RepID=UPI00364A0792